MFELRVHLTIFCKIFFITADDSNSIRSSLLYTLYTKVTVLNTNTWEQRKLREITLFHNAGIYISKDNYGTGINIVGVGDLYDKDVVDGTIYKLAPVDNDEYILQKDDLIYGESSLVPEGIARVMYVNETGEGTAFAWHTRRFKIQNNIYNSHFISLELNYSHKIRSYLMRTSTQTALTGITTDSFFKATITSPSLEEQKIVSNYFEHLDTLITLHQCQSYTSKKIHF